MKSHENLTNTQIARLAWLLNQGFKCGIRDHRINQDYPGSYMIAEAHDDSELPTRDGRDGPWCIVGDNYGELIDEAYNIWYCEL